MTMCDICDKSEQLIAHVAVISRDNVANLPSTPCQLVTPPNGISALLSPKSFNYILKFNGNKKYALYPVYQNSTRGDNKEILNKVKI